MFCKWIEIKQSEAARTVASIPSFLPSACGLLLFAFCLFPGNAKAQTGAWQRQRTGTMAWLHAAFFLDKNRGWAVGSKGTLLRTDDGGQTWLTSARPTEDVLRDIYFIDEANGWLVCERNIYELKTSSDPRTYFMRTTDGGQHWLRVDVSGLAADSRLVRAVFSRRGRGWAFGEGGAVFATRDSGATWERLAVPIRQLLLGGTFIDDDRGWIVGAGATILQTSDSGETWHVSRPIDANGARFAAASFVDNRVGWVVGSSGTIFRTLNGGRTWQKQNSGVTSDLYDVKFLDASEGWAVGAEGTIVHTSDGGLHWTSERTGVEHPIERVFFVDHSHGWAVGFGGLVVTYFRPDPPRLGN